MVECLVSVSHMCHTISSTLTVSYIDDAASRACQALKIRADVDSNHKRRSGRAVEYREPHRAPRCSSHKCDVGLLYTTPETSAQRLPRNTLVCFHLLRMSACLPSHPLTAP